MPFTVIYRLIDFFLKFCSKSIVFFNKLSIFLTTVHTLLKTKQKFFFVGVFSYFFEFNLPVSSHIKSFLTI